MTMRVRITIPIHGGPGAFIVCLRRPDYIGSWVIAPTLSALVT